jgi:DNA-binding NarL/FixJ family response regulator
MMHVGSRTPVGAVAELRPGGRSRTDAVADLSPREREVLALMAEGLSNAAVRSRLCVSEKTLESHVSSIFLKLGLTPCEHEHRRVCAVLLWLRSPFSGALAGARGEAA